LSRRIQKGEALLQYNVCSDLGSYILLVSLQNYNMETGAGNYNMIFLTLKKATPSVY
jgi:hypothetical protein